MNKGTRERRNYVHITRPEFKIKLNVPSYRRQNVYRFFQRANRKAFAMFRIIKFDKRDEHSNKILITLLSIKLGLFTKRMSRSHFIKYDYKIVTLV